MTTTSRVPGVTRNSGWNAVDAEIHARPVAPTPAQAVTATAETKRRLA